MLQIIPTAEAFFLPGQGENTRIGCLLTHGFTGAPKEMHPLGENFNRRGYTVYGIRLNGHATRPEDMIRSRWRDWLLSVEDGGHVITEEPTRAAVFQAAADFIQRVSGLA
jgi:carboxylesterase